MLKLKNPPFPPLSNVDLINEIRIDLIHLLKITLQPHTQFYTPKNVI